MCSRSRFGVVLAATLALGTGGAAVAMAQDAPDVPDMDTAYQGVADVMDAQAAAIAVPDIQKYTDLLSNDVFWIGTAADEVLTHRPGVGKHLNEVFGPMIDAKAKFEVAQGLRHVGISDDNRGAWVAEQVELTISIGDSTVMQMPYRITSVLAEKGGVWRIIAQKWSFALPNEQAYALAAEERLPTPKPITQFVSGNASPVAETFEATVRDAASWIASFSDSPSAFSFGSAPEEVLEGGKQVKEAYGRIAADRKMTITPQGGFHVSASPGGGIAFVGANLEIGLTLPHEGGAPGTPVSQTYRSLLVYSKKTRGWELVQAHFSNPQAQ